jgi:predicted  nucleic acid-binding Zn-ribbon protein
MKVIIRSDPNIKMLQQRIKELEAEVEALKKEQDETWFKWTKADIEDAVSGHVATDAELEEITTALWNKVKASGSYDAGIDTSYATEVLVHDLSNWVNTFIEENYPHLLQEETLTHGSPEPNDHP